MKRSLGLVAVCVLISVTLALSACSPKEASVSPPDFYKGATVTLVLNMSAGGGHDLNSRTIAPFLAKELGASAVVIDNQSGGGGIAALNWGKSEAPRDGKTLLEFDGGTVIFTELTGEQSPATYKLADFNFLGGWGSNPKALGDF